MLEFLGELCGETAKPTASFVKALRKVKAFSKPWRRKSKCASNGLDEDIQLRSGVPLQVCRWHIDTVRLVTGGENGTERVLA